MDVRIGINQSMRELELEMAEDTNRDGLRTQIETALANEDGTLSLTDKRGREVIIPVARVAYVELGSAAEARNIGFSV